MAKKVLIGKFEKKTNSMPRRKMKIDRRVFPNKTKDTNGIQVLENE